MEEKVVLINGPSSSGKSTLSKALQKLIKEKRNKEYQIISIDDFLKMTIEDVIYEDDIYEISLILCEKVLEVNRSKKGVIIDHVITSERIFNQLKEKLTTCELFLVQVTCPLEVLKQREVERNNRCLGSAEASSEYLFPKEGYKLTIDTFVLTAEECALQIFEIMY